MRDSLPFYDEVPHGIAENAEYRLAVWDECETREGARDVWVMASRDILWCCAALAWTYDPRLDDPHIPWIPYDYQEEDILKVQAAVGNYDLASEKSRCMGWTWMALYVLWQEWMFGLGHSYLVASRNQDLVDNKGEMQALLPKWDYLSDHLPPALMPIEERRPLLRRVNKRNGAIVVGAATTDNIGRAGRHRAVLIDEFASYDLNMGFRVIYALESVTNCRLYNSTHKGEGTAFHAACINPAIRTLKTLWWQHPEYRRGLYTVENGAMVPLDEEYEWPLDEHGNPYCYKVEHDDGTVHIQYPVLDGVKPKRSPWYDHEALVTLQGDEAAIAEELDCNVTGSAYQLFGHVWREHKAKYAEPPRRTELFTDVVDCSGASPELRVLMDQHQLQIELWIDTDAAGRPSDAWEYILATDIGAGEGASDSVHVVWNHETGEKVARLKSPWFTPEQWGEIGYRLQQWFRNAYHIWDATGPPGQLYGRKVMGLGCTRIFYRYTNDHQSNRKPTDQPGFSFAGGATIKGFVMGKYREALSHGTMINYSEAALDECGRIYLERTPSGTRIVHATERTAKDPRAAGHNHADECIADTLACRAREELGAMTKHADQEPAGPPWGSIMWARGLMREQRTEADKWAS